MAHLQGARADRRSAGRRGRAHAAEHDHVARLVERPTEPRPLPVEPRPRLGDGRIIFLNGASSSGKSTLAVALQQALREPFLHVSSDALVPMLPARRDDHGPFRWWEELRPRFFAGFHRCLPALASSGNNLVVEHIIEFPAWREELAELLRGLDVFLVGVHCPLDEIDRRERQRGDRRPGEGRSHVEDDRIHAFGPYDYEIDTCSRSPDTLARDVIAAWEQRATSGALARG